MEWKTIYPKTKKICIFDIENYLNDESRELFRKFMNILSKKYQLTYIKPKYITDDGWTLEFGRSGMMMDKVISFRDDRFFVNSININNSEVLQTIIQSVEEQYNNHFEKKYKVYIKNKMQNQKDRDRLRKQKEKEYIESIKDKVVESRFNVYKWSPKVSREKIKRLYDSDVKGLLDEDLLDEVGYGLYARCVQGKEERELIEKKQMKCHKCGAILVATKYLMTCDCGHQYLFKEYMRSFRKNNMPTGGAFAIFNRFIDEWPLMKSTAHKMRLIDWLIHEFHINLISGTRGRFVGINLIQGTKSQIEELINNLAYCDD